MASQMPGQSRDHLLHNYNLQCQQILHQGGGVNINTLSRMGQLAGQMSLTREDVEAVGPYLNLAQFDIKQIVKEGNLPSENSGKVSVGRLLVVCLVFLLIIGGTGGLLAFLLLPKNDNKPGESGPLAGANKKDSGNKKPGKQENDPDEDVNPNEKVDPAPKTKEKEKEPTPEVKKGLHPGLPQLVTNVQKVFPADTDLFEPLKSESPQKRTETWTKILPRLQEFARPFELFDPVKVMIAAYHGEEVDANADSIRQGVLELLPPMMAKVPDDPAYYKSAYWAIEVGALALKHPGIAQDRRKKLKEGLEKALATTLDVDQSKEEIQHHCGNALSQLFITALIETAPKHTAKAKKLMMKVGSISEQYLDSARQVQFRTAFAQALKTKKETKPKTEKDPKPEVVKKETADPNLTSLVGTAKSILQKEPPESTKKVLVQTVNFVLVSTLASSLAQDKSDQFDKLLAKAPKLNEYLALVKKEEAEKNPQPKAPTPNPAPKKNPPAGGGFGGGFGGGGFAGNQGGVGFGGAGQNVGFAGGNQGGGGFGGNPQGQNVGFGGVGVAGGAKGFGFRGGVQGFGVGAQQGGFGGFGGGQNVGNVGKGGFNNGGGVGFAGNPGIKNPQGKNPNPQVPKLTSDELRASIMRALKGRTIREKITGMQYLAMMAKSQKIDHLHNHEAETVAAYLLSIQSPQEFTAVAPALSSLGHLRGVSIALADFVGEKFASAPKMEGIISVLLRKKVDLGRDQGWKTKARTILLEHALNMGEVDLQPDAVERIICDLYKEQANLMGHQIPEEKKRASEILESLVRYKTEVLNRDFSLPKKDRNYLNQVKEEITAADFIAQNDLQKMVLMQRIWLQLLSIETKKAEPKHQQAASHLAQQFDNACREEDDVVRQVWLAERHILQMWMLQLNQPIMMVRN